MKYGVEMGAAATICIPSFIKVVSDIQKLLGRVCIHVYKRTDSNVISKGYYNFQNKESRLTTVVMT
jgi:hypothetical protein